MMISDIDFSHLEYVSAFKTISVCENVKLVVTAITFLDKKDSIAHLEGLELAFAKNELEKNGKYIKLATVYRSEDDIICTDTPVKVLFNEVNNTYRSVSRSPEEAERLDILTDVEFVEMVFDRSEDKFVYM
jgi:hypothetical protein